MNSPSVMPSITFATVDDSSQKKSVNNGYYIGKELKRHFPSAFLFNTKRLTWGQVVKYGLQKSVSDMRGFDRPVFCEPELIRQRAEQLIAFTSGTTSKFVFSNGPIPVAGLSGTIPYAFYTDAPIGALREMGHYFERWTKDSVQQFENLDRKAVEGADAVIYHSTWAAKYAIQSYGADSNKVFVVPPGANLDSRIAERVSIDKKAGNQCTLLFFGGDWRRKGGPKAVETTNELIKMGIDAKLLVCGPPKVPSDLSNLTFVELLPRIDKDIPADVDRMIEMFGQTDFLLLPTQSDASAGAARESSAFGVPPVTTEVGGMPDLISDGINGILVKSDAKGSHIAKQIAENYLSDIDRQSMRKEARANFMTRLNWTDSMNSLAKILKNHTSICETF